ncbi:MAG: hypothetical protein WBB94_04550, partial [Candidatus Saccharimonadaceae bacterium]
MIPSQLTPELTIIFLLSVAAFVLSMALTPLYTFFAYRYKFWKKQRKTSVTGEALEIFTKLHAKKFLRPIPTMAGVIGITAITAVTLLVNLDRGQTWLPLAALIGGGVVGLIDDLINVRGDGNGVAGLRSSIKFVLIIIGALALGWFFYAKLGYQSMHVPYLG